MIQGAGTTPRCTSSNIYLTTSRRKASHETTHQKHSKRCTALSKSRTSGAQTLKMWVARCVISVNPFTPVSLNPSQILKADHRAWISAFIRFQIDQLDRTMDAAMDSELVVHVVENTTGVRPSEAMLLSAIAEDPPKFTLGSKQSKKLKIGDLQASGPTFNPAFTSFRSRVSIEIQKMSSEPANAVQDTQQVTSISFQLPAL